MGLLLFARGPKGSASSSNSNAVKNNNINNNNNTSSNNTTTVVYAAQAQAEHRTPDTAATAQQETETETILPAVVMPPDAEIILQAVRARQEEFEQDLTQTIARFEQRCVEITRKYHEMEAMRAAGADAQAEIVDLNGECNALALAQVRELLRLEPLGRRAIPMAFSWTTTRPLIDQILGEEEEEEEQTPTHRVWAGIEQRLDGLVGSRAEVEEVRAYARRAVRALDNPEEDHGVSSPGPHAA